MIAWECTAPRRQKLRDLGERHPCDLDCCPLGEAEPYLER